MTQPQQDSGTPRCVGQELQDKDYEGIECPFCRGQNVGLMALFGGNAGESLLRCHACHSLFHWVKWQGRLPPHPAAAAEPWTDRH